MSSHACWRCPAKFGTTRELQRHGRDEHKIDFGVICCWCEDLERSFASMYELKRHCERNHLPLMNDLPDAFFASRNGFWLSSSPDDYKCLLGHSDCVSPEASEARKCVQRWVAKSSSPSRQFEAWTRGWGLRSEEPAAKKPCTDSSSELGGYSPVSEAEDPTPQETPCLRGALPHPFPTGSTTVVSDNPPASDEIQTSTSLEVVTTEQTELPPAAQPILTVTSTSLPTVVDVPRPQLRVRALELLKTGVMPLLHPAPRAWDIDESVQLTRGETTLLWPPRGWRSFTPTQLLMAVEYGAMTLEFHDGVRNISKMNLMDKYHFLALPGMAQIMMTTQEAYEHQARIAMCDSLLYLIQVDEGDDSLVTMLEMACVFRDSSTDDLVGQVEEAGIAIQL